VSRETEWVTIENAAKVSAPTMFSRPKPKRKKFTSVESFSAQMEKPHRKSPDAPNVLNTQTVVKKIGEKRGRLVTPGTGLPVTVALFSLFFSNCSVSFLDCAEKRHRREQSQRHIGTANPFSELT
jgi:hypothetical protein